MWGEWAGSDRGRGDHLLARRLNGWTLMMASSDGSGRRAAPCRASSGASRVVAFRNWPGDLDGTLDAAHLIETTGTGAMVAFYNLIVQLSTDAAMIPYVFCSVVEAVMFVTRRPLSRVLRLGPFMPVSLVAFVFSLGTIYGSGATAGMWALILLLLAAPVWVFLAHPQGGEET
jgi:hypothetical protein